MFLQSSSRSGHRWPRRAEKLNPCMFKFLYTTWSFHDAPHMKPEIVMKSAAPNVGTTFSQISSRSGHHWPRRAEKLNPCTFKLLYTTWSFHDAPHIKPEIVMKGAAPNVGTTFSQISSRSGHHWPRRAEKLNPCTFEFPYTT